MGAPQLVDGDEGATGFAAAAAGALVGGWLGFHAIEGLLVAPDHDRGCDCGREPRLLALDIAWDRQARERFAATRSKETLEVRPSTG